MSAADHGYSGPDAEAMMDRDNQLCTCHHKNVSHASSPAGIGRGRCGFCDCHTFTTTSKDTK